MTSVTMWACEGLAQRCCTVTVQAAGDATCRALRAKKLTRRIEEVGDAALVLGHLLVVPHAVPKQGLGVKLDPHGSKETGSHGQLRRVAVEAQ